MLLLDALCFKWLSVFILLRISNNLTDKIIPVDFLKIILVSVSNVRVITLSLIFHKLSYYYDTLKASLFYAESEVKNEANTSFHDGI